MSFRAKRYVDNTNILVKRPPAPNFNITLDFPFARKAMSTDIETIRSFLKQELSKNTRYAQVWKYATEMFEKKKSSLTSKKPLPDEFHIAIIAYTFEIPLTGGSTLEIYVEFNKLSRELKDEASWARFPYKSMYCLLAQATSSVESQPSNNKGPYYRGVRFHYSPDFPDEELLVDFSQFTSCSTSKEKALGFIGDNKGTLIVLPHPPMAGYGIQKYSQFAGEEEVLICPWSTFSIGGIKKGDKIQEIALVSMGPYFEQLSYTIEKSKPLSFFGGLFGR